MKTLKMMFEGKDIKQLTQAVELALQNNNESPFFAERAIPLIDAIYSILVPLHEQNLLFNPEGQPIDSYNFEEFLRWTDMVSLKNLYFTIKESNEKGMLTRTKYKDATFTPIDLTKLRDYVKRFNIHEEFEHEDFPIANYNLHIGIASVIKEVV